LLNPPQSHKGKRLKIFYATQFGVAPPHFVVFANNSDLMKDNYKRYLENKLREAFGFFGTPIRISVRERSA
jgi:GTP-binding protein